MPKWLGLLLVCVLVACRSVAVPAGGEVRPPALEAERIVTADDYVLPLRHWPAVETASVVVLALHGFNDHAGAFEVLAEALAPAGVSLYAYDQRGFGSTEGFGAWAGSETLVADARLAASLLRDRYPDRPLYLLGKSMGGAVALLAMNTETPPEVDGTVLIAPAVMGRAVMPGYQRFALWLAEHVAPGLPLSVELGHALGFHPTDDEDVIKSLRADPLVIDYPRVAAVGGLVDLMDAALLAAPELASPVLLLYGARDDMVPVHATCRLLESVAAGGGARFWQVALYPEGFHMLTRYSGGATTHDDILAWLRGSNGDRFLDPDCAVTELCR